MRSRRLVPVLLLAAAAAALFWLRPWESADPSPEPLAPGDRTAPDRASLEGRRAAAPSESPPVRRERTTGPAKTDAEPRVWTVPEVPPSTARLVGRVVDADGRAVVGAAVIAFRPPTPDEAFPKRQAGDRGSTVIQWIPLDARATTSEDGRFELAVPATRLMVQVSPPLGMAWTGVVESPTDPLEVTLERVLSVKGRVRDAVTGAPIEGARVVASPVVPRPGIGWDLQAATAADGAFEVLVVPEGEVDLSVLVARRRSDSLGLDSEDPPEGVEARAKARVQAGAMDVDLRVWRGFELSGTVETDRGGPPGAGVGVWIYARSAQGQPDQRRQAHAPVGADGLFRIDALPGGSYDLLFDPPAGSADLAATWVRDVTPPKDNLRVVLARGAVLRGRLVDASGRPVVAKGGFVYVIEQGTTWGGVDSRYATLDGRGGFATPALPSDRLYDLLARGFAGFSEARATGLSPLRDDVVITLQSAREIRGMVRGPDGAIVGPGVRVVAWMPNSDLREAGRMGTAFTDVHGQFVLEGLTGERYTIAAGGGGSAHAPGEPLLGVAPGGPLIDVRVTKGVTLSGLLVDPRGKPVQTQGLHAGGSGGMADVTWTRVDDSQGRFLIPGLRTARYHLGLYRDAKYVDLGEFDAPATDVKIVVPDP